MSLFFRKPLDDALRGMEPIMRVRSPLRTLAPMLISMAATWIVYVPIHELLHVAGCEVAGGEAYELEIKALYGGHILKKIFPDLIKVGGHYAGRLSSFEWYGNDLIYLVTDFMPFLLTVFIGVPLVYLCMRRRRPWLFGSAVVVGFAPFYNLPGDYYEMASISLTRFLTLFRDGGAPLYQGLRSDDVFTLVKNVFVTPAEMGLNSGIDYLAAALIIPASIVIAVLLAFVTYWMGVWFSRTVLRLEAKPAVS